MTDVRVHPSHYVGKNVRVKLDEKVIVEGQLLALGDMGSLVVREPETEETWFCWPALEIEEMK